MIPNVLSSREANKAARRAVSAKAQERSIGKCNQLGNCDP